ncbi:hypothetical protein CSE899_06338 [Cronobacter sakazakii E899]|nr:hypothetical protein CSE899_06338 [Cronobacter sakazakii E899]
MTQHTRRVANRRDGLAAAPVVFDKRDRNRVIGEIPQRAVAARIKQRVILVGVDFIEPRGIRQPV